jgi:hypothetical protein
VRVETRAEDPSPLVGWRMSAVDYDITVPRDCTLDVHGVKSRVSCTGSCADVRIRTVTGDVEVSGISGNTSVTTVNGDIQGRELEGTLETHTTNGGLKVTRSRLAGFDLHSTNGGFTVETPLTSGGTYRASTTNGSARLFVPEGTGARVRMSTTNGSVSTELPAEITTSTRRAWEGIINGGGAEVELKTMNGSLRVGRGGSRLPPASLPTQPTTPAAKHEEPSDPPADDATTELLRALAAGELSVEDAMARLDQASGEEGIDEGL